MIVKTDNCFISLTILQVLQLLHSGIQLLFGNLVLVFRLVEQLFLLGSVCLQLADFALVLFDSDFCSSQSVMLDLEYSKC